MPKKRPAGHPNKKNSKDNKDKDEEDEEGEKPICSAEQRPTSAITLKTRIDNVRLMFSVFERMRQVPTSLNIVCGSIGRGKSVATMAYLIYLQKSKKYDEVIIISSTCFTGFWSKNGIPKRQQVEGVTMEQLELLKEMQRRAKKPKQILLVMDDIYDGKIDTTHNNRAFEAWVSTLRHFHISLILICQNISMVSKKIRSQCHGILLFDQVGYDNIKTLFETCSCGEERKQFYQSFYDNTKDNGCIYIDCTKNAHDPDRSICFKIDLKASGVKLL